MFLKAPLPKLVCRYLGVEKPPGECTHPGLMLDKYAWSYADRPDDKVEFQRDVQKPTLEAVAALSSREPPELNFAALRGRWEGALHAVKARFLKATTAGPFTLHLARASALENAGICLHPLYGFVYLPGSGVKGMTHAYACEVWLPAQPEKQQAWQTICNVFGWAPAPWLNDLAKRHGVKAPKESCAGAVVFHDAWPETWPKLTVDILNSHHSQYYQEKGPPGDWESPVPVYFLSVPAGQTFRFAVGKRRDDGAECLLNRAEQWLEGALVHLGAGAKTATGYGTFQIVDKPAPIAEKAEGHRVDCATVLELITPGFLAGARQQKDDCELRPATLRGLLRWWWRTLHVGFVDGGTLRRMEAAVWGDTTTGGAVRLTLRPDPENKVVPLAYDREGVRKINNLPAPPNNKTTQGLFYHSFGMDDFKQEDGQRVRARRCFVPPGARWTVTLVARPSEFVVKGKRTIPLPAALVLDQARAALRLFCHFGGAGAKARKGFGSFGDPHAPATLDLAALKKQAEEFRRVCGHGGVAFDDNKAESAALEQMLPVLEVPFPGWKNTWLALDQAGDVAQRFAQGYKHQAEKKALGLPRKIGHPVKGVFRPGRHVQDRHTSPVFFHFARQGDGLVLRVAALPAKELPDLKTSRQFLGGLLKHLGEELPKRVTLHAVAGKKKAVDPQAPGGAAAALGTAPKPGDRVDAELLSEKTKKGGWRAKHLSSGLTGPITNTKDVPTEAKAGDKLALVVSAVKPDGLDFRYPTKAEEEKAKQSPKSPGMPPRRH